MAAIPDLLTIPENVSCPWLERPYALLSWWDMEQFAAVAFYHIGHLLSEAKEVTKSEQKALDAPAELKAQTRGNRLELLEHINALFRLYPILHRP